MADIRDLEARAQSYELSDDPTFEDDLCGHLRSVEGTGWTIETSRALDPGDDDRGRGAAWWLAGRGVTVCALDRSVIDRDGDPLPIGRVVAPRTGLDPDGFTTRELPDGDVPVEIGEGRVDVVAVAGREVMLVRDLDRPESADGDLGTDDPPAGAIAPLAFVAEAWEPPVDVEFSLWLAVDDAAGGEQPPGGDRPRLVRIERERSPEADWTAVVEEPGRYVRLRADATPPGRDGPPPGDVRIPGPPDEALRAVAPCRGAIVGACLLHLLDAQRRTSRLGVVELDELLDGVPDAVGIDGSIAATTIRDVVDASPFISRFKLGNAVYPYLSPSGITRAAELSQRLGGDVTPDGALELMAGQNTSIASTIKDIQHRSRRGDLSPYYGGRR